ncbi:MAG: ROK family protein, partial [Clostridia bacterium]|nr:ROK family protein [Clostridia bacterium]
MKNASTDLLGVDIGGTNVKIGVIDSEYNVKEFIKFKTEKDDVDAMLGSICGVIRDLSQKYSFDFVGVGSPGRIEDNRTVIEAGNIAYDNTPCADIIEQKTGLPVYLDNDANCALYGEKFAGAGKNISDMLVLTIGTGVGGGIMIGRKCYRGHNGRAGELG